MSMKHLFKIYTMAGLVVATLSCMSVPVYAQSARDRMAQQEAGPIAFSIIAQARKVASSTSSTSSNEPEAVSNASTEPDDAPNLAPPSEELIMLRRRVEELEARTSSIVEEPTGFDEEEQEPLPGGAVIFGVAAVGALAGVLAGGENTGTIRTLAASGAIGGLIGGSLIATGMKIDDGGVTGAGIVLSVAAVALPFIVTRASQPNQRGY